MSQIIKENRTMEVYEYLARMENLRQLLLNPPDRQWAKDVLKLYVSVKATPEKFQEKDELIQEVSCCLILKLDKGVTPPLFEKITGIDPDIATKDEFHSGLYQWLQADVIRFGPRSKAMSEVKPGMRVRVLPDEVKWTRLDGEKSYEVASVQFPYLSLAGETGLRPISKFEMVQDTESGGAG